MADEPILEITEKALEKILEIRTEEPDGDELALGMRTTGISGSQFSYDMVMMKVSDIDPADHVEVHGELTIFIPKDSVENMRGAVLGMSRNLLEPGLALDNPNSPSPKIETAGPPVDLSGPIEQQVTQVLTEQINPAIASHGGMAELVAVDGATAYVRLGGGCQGCGMAEVTLSQGIEQAIIGAVPAISTVLDVTDHAAGESPYYEAAKK